MHLSVGHFTISTRFQFRRCKLTITIFVFMCMCVCVTMPKNKIQSKWQFFVAVSISLAIYGRFTLFFFGFCFLFHFYFFDNQFAHELARLVDWMLDFYITHLIALRTSQTTQKLRHSSFIPSVHICYFDLSFISDFGAVFLFKTKKKILIFNCTKNYSNWNSKSNFQSMLTIQWFYLLSHLTWFDWLYFRFVC